jgi:hypothetical protein
MIDPPIYPLSAFLSSTLVVGRREQGKWAFRHSLVRCPLPTYLRVVHPALLPFPSLTIATICTIRSCGATPETICNHPHTYHVLCCAVVCVCVCVVWCAVLCCAVVCCGVLCVCVWCCVVLCCLVVSCGVLWCVVSLLS